MSKIVIRTMIKRISDVIKRKDFKIIFVSGMLLTTLGTSAKLMSVSEELREVKNDNEILAWKNERLEKSNKELWDKNEEARPYFELKETEREVLIKESKEKQDELNRQKREEEAEKQRRLVEGTNVFENNNVKINFKKATSTGIEFLVENKTDVEITIQAGSVAVNGISTDNIIMSDHVAPKSKGVVTARCKLDISGDVQTVSGKLRIIDFSRNLDTEDVIFTNIDVN